MFTGKLYFFILHFVSFCFVGICLRLKKIDKKILNREGRGDLMNAIRSKYYKLFSNIFIISYNYTLYIENFTREQWVILMHTIYGWL